MTSPSTTISSDPSAIAHFEVRGVRFKVDVADMPHSPTANPYFRLAKHGYLYEPVMTDCVAQILSQETDHCFLDVGSRMGYYASLAVAFIADSGRVHGVEADPVYAPRTPRSCAATGYPNVAVHNVILSDVEQQAGIDGHRGVVYDGSSEDLVTTTITADALCADRGFAPTIVKVDVHGCEGKVLKGMETVLREHVRYLLLELHDSFRLEQYSPGISRSQLLRFLEDLGFSIFYVAGHELPVNPAGERGFTYRPLKNISPDVFYDRSDTVMFLLASKSPDLASVLGPSLDDPRFF
jgi:FkbM family methyltransferase